MSTEKVTGLNQEQFLKVQSRDEALAPFTSALRPAPLGVEEVALERLVGGVPAKLGEPGIVTHGVALKLGKPLCLAACGGKVQVGMVGVNVPIPVPLAYHTFGGWKRSAFGDLNQHGPDAFRFYTKTKTVTGRWPSGIKDGASFVIPTMG
jgi:hypothetical protein